MGQATLSKKTYTIGLILKLGTILSCCLGLYFQVIEWQSVFFGPNSTFLYFTTQSNIWIAAICLVFLIIDLRSKGNRQVSNWLYVVKFMFTVAIMLTFIVFAVLLTPQQEMDYLISGTNICLHNLTPIFAIIDFILCDYGYLSSKKHILLGTILPILYFIVTLILSFNGVGYGDDRIVPYFFLDYKKLGWLSVGDNGIGVIYWVIIISFMVLAMGANLLGIKYLRAKGSMSKTQEYNWHIFYGCVFNLALQNRIYLTFLRGNPHKVAWPRGY